MRHFRICVLTLAAMNLLGLSRLQAGILFDNGPAAAVDIGRQNCDAYTVYDDFTLSTSSIIEGVRWGEHDLQSNPQGFFYNSTDITFFNAIPAATSEVFSGNLVASRIPNGSPEVFSKIGFDYSVTGLSLNLAAGTYYIGIHSLFDGGELSSWDQAAGNNSSIPGRFQTSHPPDAGNFVGNEDSVFQILGTPQTDPPSDPAPALVAEPSTLVTSSILLGIFGLRRVRLNCH